LGDWFGSGKLVPARFAIDFIIMTMSINVAKNAASAFVQIELTDTRKLSRRLVAFWELPLEQLKHGK